MKKFIIDVEQVGYATYEMEGPSEERVREVMESGGACGGPNDVITVVCRRTKHKSTKVLGISANDNRK